MKHVSDMLVQYTEMILVIVFIINTKRCHKACNHFTGVARVPFHLLPVVTLICSGCEQWNYVIMGAMASHITSLTIVYSTVYSGADERKHQSPASLAFVWGIHRWPVNSTHKGPVTRKMFPLDDVIMNNKIIKKYALLTVCEENPAMNRWTWLFKTLLLQIKIWPRKRNKRLFDNNE